MVPYNIRVLQRRLCRNTSQSQCQSHLPRLQAWDLLDTFLVQQHVHVAVETVVSGHTCRSSWRRLVELVSCQVLKTKKMTKQQEEEIWAKLLQWMLSLLDLLQ